ncbi:hypothetical protein JCM3770_001162 [Rhodotorula araucariae]
MPGVVREGIKTMRKRAVEAGQPEWDPLRYEHDPRVTSAVYAMSKSEDPMLHNASNHKNRPTDPASGRHAAAPSIGASSSVLRGGVSPRRDHAAITGDVSDNDEDMGPADNELDPDFLVHAKKPRQHLPSS